MRKDVYEVIFSVKNGIDKYETVLVAAKSKEKALKRAYRAKMLEYKNVHAETEITKVFHTSVWHDYEVYVLLQRGWTVG